MSELKLFVWRDVLRDYTPGVVFCWAHNETEARKLIFEECSYINDAEIAKSPEVYDQKSDSFAFVLWGGG